MGDGFQRKIDTIVYSIVESEKINNNRIDEADISESIKKAISDLNDVGKMLVLDDLFNDAGKTPSKLLTLDGKISIESLNRVVNAKIEEAARGGIDLRKDAPVIFKDTKLLAVDAALTIATINVMVNNFKDLSYNQKKEIFDNWNLLTSHQKSSVLKSQSESLLEQALEEQNPEKKSLFKKASSATNSISQRIEEESQLTDEQVDLELEILLRQNPNFKLIYEKLSNKGMPTRKIYQYLIEKKGQEIFKNGIDIENKEIDGKKMLTLNQYFDQEDTKQKEAKFLRDPNFHKYLGLTREEVFKLSQEEILVKGSTYLFRTSPEILKYYGITPEEAELMSDEKCKDMFDQYNAYLLKIDENGKSENLEDKIKQEIEQLPIALEKAGFSQEEIKTNLSIYTNFLNRIDSNEINQLSTWSPERLSSFLSGAFNKFGMNEQIAGILSKINFSGKLFDILGNEEQKKEFFEQFDKVINQEHIQNKHEPLTGELEQIFSQYFQDNAVDMNVSAIEAQQKHLTEEKQQDGQAQQPEEQKVDSSLSVTEIRVAPEEHTQESATSPEQETLEETGQNMAMVKQDNSFIGKIRRAMSKIKSSIKTKVSKFFGKNENITEEDKKTSSEQVETTSPKLHNTLDRYTIENNHIEENAFKDFKDNESVPTENESDKELGD